MHEIMTALSYGHNIHTRSRFYNFSFIIASVGALPYAKCSKLSVICTLFQLTC